MVLTFDNDKVLLWIYCHQSIFYVNVLYRTVVLYAQQVILQFPDITSFLMIYRNIDFIFQN